MKIKKPAKPATPQKPIFLQDSDGKLYKASLVKDEEIPLDGEEVVKEPLEDEEEETVVVKLTKAQYEKLLALLAKEEVADEDPEEVDEEEEKPEVVDTKDSKKKSTFVKSSNSVEPEANVNDSVNDTDIEIDEAWANRYKSK